MSYSGRSVAGAALAISVFAAPTARVSANPLTICDIQYTTNSDGSSDYHNQVVDCAGGIVVGKWDGGAYPRIMLQDPDCPAVLADPNCPQGWGGIQVKDWTWPYGLYDNVEIGDWVVLTNVQVVEKVGGTFLYWDSVWHPEFTKTPGHPVPPLVEVSVSDIPAPIEGPPYEWYVENHDAECYESVRIVVRDVTVNAMNLGQAQDNYSLRNPAQEDCWAADYMNENKVSWEKYHPFVGLDRHFCALAGIFEQYTGGRFDYYQIVTLKTEDLAICGNLDCDTAEVNLDDVPAFVSALTDPEGYQLNYPDCGIQAADLNGDGVLNGGDVQPFVDLLLSLPP